MADISLNIKKIITDLEEKITNKEDMEIAKVEIFNLYNLFLDELTRINEISTEQITKLAMEQQLTNEKIEKIEKSLKKIENDIYLDDDEEEDEYSMEIACPYCNKEFVVEMDEIADKDEISCPECNNTIELDWGKDCNCDDCDDDCDCCDGECHHHHYEEDDM